MSSYLRYCCEKCWYSTILSRYNHHPHHRYSKDATLLQAFRFFQARVCEHLPVPKSERRADGSFELDSDRVNNPGFLSVHQRQKTRVIVNQDAYTVRLAHQRHGGHLVVGHGEPFPLSVAEHPGGAVRAHAVVPGHQRFSHTHTKLLRLFNRHLPVVSSIANLLVTKYDRPVSETLGVVLHVAGVQAQHAVDDASVSLEEVQTAVSCPLIKLKLQIYREKKTIGIYFFIIFCSIFKNVGLIGISMGTQIWLLCAVKVFKIDLSIIYELQAS